MNIHCKNTVAPKHSPHHLHSPLKSIAEIQVSFCPVKTWILAHLSIWGHHVMRCVSHPSHVLCSLIISPWRRSMWRQASCFPRDFFFWFCLHMLLHTGWSKVTKHVSHLEWKTVRLVMVLSFIGFYFNWWRYFVRLCFLHRQALPKWKSALLSQKSKIVSVH